MVAWLIIFGLLNAPSWLLVLALAGNITFYILMKNSAREYLKNNHVVCLGMISQQSVLDQYKKYRIEEFNKIYLDPWEAEINSIKNNGIESINQNDQNSLYTIVKNELINKCNIIDNQIVFEQSKVAEIQTALDKSIDDIYTLAPTINSKETIVDDLVVDSEYNNGVLSPYVSLGFASREAFGIKKLVSIKHDIKPVVITYSSETYKTGEYFRKITARTIEQLMKGFYQENYYDFINMVLVDFESLHFPHSRTKGLMDVVRNKTGFNELVANVTQNRNEIDNLMDGKISTINPNRLKNKENIFKYNVAYFVGLDFSTIDREVVQLFAGGQHFGFIPFIFIPEEFINSLLDEKNAIKLFSNVLKEACDNMRIYKLEELSAEFEYGLVISQRKDLILERLTVNRLISFDDIFDELDNGEQTISEECIYIDVNGLTKDIFDNLSNYEEQYDFRYFTLDGTTPDFMERNKVMSI